MGWYWHLFEDFLLPWRVCNLGPVFNKISTQFCFYVPALEIWLFFFFFLHISTLSASTYTFCIFVHMTTAFKASSTKSSRFYGLSYQYQNRKTWLFYFKLFSSREMGLSRYLWPTHFSMEKKKKLCITTENCIEMWMQGWHWSIHRICFMHCISVQLWPTCMRDARATWQALCWAGKLFVAISRHCTGFR